MSASDRIITITLNPAVGRIFEVDDVAAGRHLRGRRIDMYPSGKGITVSRALSQLGTPSIAIGLVGEHEFRWFEKRLAAVGPGLITSQLLRAHTPTRDNIILLDLKNVNATYIRDRGHPVSEVDLERIQAKVAMLACENRILFFGGTLPPEVSIDWYRQLIARSIEAGARVMVTGPAEVLGALDDLRAWVLRANRSAAGELTGRSITDAESAAKAAAEIRQRGFEAVIVTAGAQGTAIAMESETLVGHCEIGPHQFVNKVACGDSLSAGFLHRWIQDADWLEAFREGIAIAAANAMTPFAGMLMPDLVEETKELTNVQSMNAHAG